MRQHLLQSWVRRASSQGRYALKAAAATVAASTTLVATSTLCDDGKERQPPIDLSSTPMIPTSVVEEETSSLTKAKIRRVTTTAIYAPNEPITDVEEDEEDPYGNLPEEDEPVSCPLYRTLRQGPCGRLFRKLELCEKDHPSSSEDCVKYATPVDECVRQYMAYCTLVSRNISQEEMEGIMKASEENSQTWTLAPPTFNYDDLIYFYKDSSTAIADLDIDDNDDDQEKSDSPEYHPQICFATATLEAIDQDSRALQWAYVKDENGYMIGINYFGRMEMNGDKEEELGAFSDKNKDEVPKVPVVNFYLQPLKTRTATLYAVYTKIADDGTIDTVMYQTEPTKLMEVARGAGIG